MKKIYTCFCTDFIHDGHLNIIREAQKYGEVIVGVLSDKAMIRFNKFPTVSFEERMELVKSIKGVSQVVVQEDVMYDTIVETIKPDYIIHGDNWKEEPMNVIRENAIALMNKTGGEVIEVPYTKSAHVNLLDSKYNLKRSMPEFRRKRLRELLNLRDIVKTIEVHSGLTGLIAEKTIVERNDCSNA